MLGKDIIAYFIWFLFAFSAFFSYLTYEISGDYFLNFYLFKEYMYKNGILFFLVFFLFLYIFIVILIKYSKVLKKITIKKSKKIYLKKIAKIWLESDENLKNIKKEILLSEEENKIGLSKETVAILNLLLNEEIDIEFINKYIKPYLKAFTKEEIEIVFELYKLLNKEKEISSVASICKEDYDKKTYNKRCSLGEGLTVYQILSTVSLYNHTIHVVDNTLNILLQKDREIFLFNYSKSIIVALAHDIGKIVNIKRLEEKPVDDMLYKQNSHEYISKIILESTFPKYKDIKLICDIVVAHHLKESFIDYKDKKLKVNTAKDYIKVLKQADHLARENEVKEYFSKTKKEFIIDNNINLLKEKDNNQGLVYEEEFSGEKNNIEIKKIEKEEKNINKLEEFYYGFTDDNIQKLIETLINNVNIVKILKNSSKVKIMSVSKNNIIYFPMTEFLLFSKRAGVNVTKKNEVECLIKYLKIDNCIKGICMLKVKNFSNYAYRNEIEYVGFYAQSLGYDVNRLELLKRNSSYFRNIEIELV